MKSLVVPVGISGDKIDHDEPAFLPDKVSILSLVASAKKVVSRKLNHPFREMLSTSIRKGHLPAN